MSRTARPPRQISAAAIGLGPLFPTLALRQVWKSHRYDCRLDDSYLFAAMEPLTQDAGRTTAVPRGLREKVI